MIPRYLPAVDWRLRLRAARVARTDATPALVAALAPGQVFAGCLALAALRDGLNAYFGDLARRAGGGEVVMSAQVCPLVPLAACHAGFTPRFVDIASDRPVPSGRQLSAAVGPAVKAVVVAPLYGHPGEAPEALLAALGGRPLFVDLAQGIGLNVLEPLLARADAVGFSFGIGKGLDTGGGLLLTRGELDVSGAMRVSLGIGAQLRSAALRAIAACGLYAVVARAVERAAEADPADFDPAVRILEDERAHAWWLARLGIFLGEVELARDRAAALRTRLGGHAALAHADALFSKEATHLRQIVRLANAGRRDAVLAKLRHSGIDCAAAGEPLPSRYIAGERGEYPAAAAFLADSIRLPFLGRLTQRQFSHLAAALERALD